jgi:hypothetical protein
LFQAADKAIATNDGVVVIVTVLLLAVFVKSNKWQSSRHFESDSTCRDGCKILIRPFPAAVDQSENGDHEGEQLLSCQ